MNDWAVGIATALIAVAGSFLVAFFTARHEMKKDLVDRRFKVYRKLLKILRNLKRDFEYLSDGKGLHDLSSIEIDVKICGSRHLITLVTSLRKRMEKALDEYGEEIAYKSHNASEQARHDAEKGLGDRDVLELEYLGELGLLDDSPRPSERDQALMDDIDLDRFTTEIIREVRRSVGSREFRLAVWFRKTKLYEKVRLWS